MMTKWIAGMLMMAMCVAARGQSQPQGRFALTAAQIAHTLSGKGIQIEAGQVSLLANVVATEPQPLLDVLSVEPLSDRWSGQHSEARSLVKLACHLPGTCLPFYAIVSSSGGAAGTAKSALAATGNAALKPNATVTMRAGTHAMLVMDDDRAHIQVAVVTLESGAVGHRIRVASPDHKQFYIGEVVSANLLKRSF
jgi:hypothetical protein